MKSSKIFNYVWGRANSFWKKKYNKNQWAYVRVTLYCTKKIFAQKVSTFDAFYLYFYDRHKYVFAGFCAFIFHFICLIALNYSRFVFFRAIIVLNNECSCQLYLIRLLYIQQPIQDQIFWGQVHSKGGWPLSLNKFTKNISSCQWLRSLGGICLISCEPFYSIFKTWFKGTWIKVFVLKGKWGKNSIYSIVHHYADKKIISSF